MHKLSDQGAAALAEYIEDAAARRYRGTNPPPIPSQPKRQRPAKTVRNDQLLADLEQARLMRGWGGYSEVARKHGISHQRVRDIVKDAGRLDLLVRPPRARQVPSKRDMDLIEVRCRLAIILRVAYFMSWYQTTEALGMFTQVNVRRVPTRVVDTMRLLRSVKRYCARHNLNMQLLFHVPGQEKGANATKAWQAHVVETGLVVEDFGISKTNLNIPPALMEKLNGIQGNLSRA